MGQRLKDRVAVVTGAGRGIGRGIALLLAEAGAKVVVNDLGSERDGTGASISPANDVVAEIKSQGGIAVANYDSVATWQGAENIIKATVDNFGRIDILVNNAGILRDRMIFNMTEQEWDAVIRVHLYGNFFCTRHASVYMRQQRYGRIICISSSADAGNLGQANYSAAKAGIIGLVRTAARDLGRYGVTVNAVYPGAATRLTVTPELQAAWEKAAAAGTPVKEAEELVKLPPEDVAPFVVYLATDETANINGQVFLARGGYVCYYPPPAPSKTVYKGARWTLDELIDIVPKTIADGLVNPAPPQPPKQ